MNICTQRQSLTSHSLITLDCIYIYSNIHCPSLLPHTPSISAICRRRAAFTTTTAGVTIINLRFDCCKRFRFLQPQPLATHHHIETRQQPQQVLQSTHRGSPTALHDSVSSATTGVTLPTKIRRDRILNLFWLLYIAAV